MFITSFITSVDSAIEVINGVIRTVDVGRISAVRLSEVPGKSHTNQPLDGMTTARDDSTRIRLITGLALASGQK